MKALNSSSSEALDHPTEGGLFLRMSPTRLVGDDLAAVLCRGEEEWFLRVLRAEHDADAFRAAQAADEGTIHVMPQVRAVAAGQPAARLLIGLERIEQARAARAQERPRRRILHARCGRRRAPRHLLAPRHRRKVASRIGQRAICTCQALQTR